MQISSLLNNPKVVTSIATLGFFQGLTDFLNPIIQLLIAIFTALYLRQKWLNEKKQNEHSSNSKNNPR